MIRSDQSARWRHVLGPHGREGFTELMASPVFGFVAGRHGDAVMFFSAAVLGIASLGAWLWLEHRHGGPARA